MRYEWMTEDLAQKFKPLLDQYAYFPDPDGRTLPVLPAPPTAKLAYVEGSEPYELQAAGLVALADGGYAVIIVSGCSCWPDRGTTEVYVGASPEAALHSAAAGYWKNLVRQLRLTYFEGLAWSGH